MCEIVCNQYCQLARQIADAEWELESLLRRTVLTQPHLYQNALNELERRGDKRAYDLLQTIAVAIKVKMTPVPIKEYARTLPSPSIMGQINGENNGLPVRGR